MMGQFSVMDVVFGPAAVGVNEAEVPVWGVPPSSHDALTVYEVPAASPLHVTWPLASVVPSQVPKAGLSVSVTVPLASAEASDLDTVTVTDASVGAV